MPTANVVNMAGTKVGEIELAESIFGIEPNPAVVHEVSRITWPTAVRVLRAL